MADSNPLGRIVPKLNQNGRKRLFGFLDSIDVPTAGQLREWIASASDSDVHRLSVLLNRAHGLYQIADWWKSVSPEPAPAPKVTKQNSRPKGGRVPETADGARLSRRARLRSGFRWLAIGLVLMFSKTLWNLAFGGQPGTTRWHGIEILGLLMFLSGTGKLAEARGYSKWWGLMGLLFPVGLLVVLMLPEKSGFRRSRPRR